MQSIYGKRWVFSDVSALCGARYFDVNQENIWTTRNTERDLAVITILNLGADFLKKKTGKKSWLGKIKFY